MFATLSLCTKANKPKKEHYFIDYTTDSSPIYEQWLTEEENLRNADFVCRECPDAELIASVVEAEAGNQGYLGMRYVADVILNRIESEEFPNDAEAVIYQKGQFATAYNLGNPTEEIIEIVNQEYESRTNNEILFFRTEKYHSGRTDCFQHGEHYFSK